MDDREEEVFFKWEGEEEVEMGEEREGNETRKNREKKTETERLRMGRRSREGGREGNGTDTRSRRCAHMRLLRLVNLITVCCKQELIKLKMGEK